MQWESRGLVYGPDGSQAWAAHSALQPTPIVIRDGEIRVFVGFRDPSGRSSVGFVDVDARHPERVLRVSDAPVLTPGAQEAFDRDGVVPCAVAQVDGELRLYYAGYDTRGAERFRVFGGLATSADGGETFARWREEPLLPPTPAERLFRVVHSAIHDHEGWQVWYGAGSKFRQGLTKTLPVYDIRHMRSPDGRRFPEEGRICIAVQADEHRVGRPYVLRGDDAFYMLYGAGTESRPYVLRAARSIDGVDWEPVEFTLVPSGDDWDRTIAAYPAVIAGEEDVFLFYNGDDYGRAGFGYAVLTSPSPEWRAAASRHTASLRVGG